jgi:hypothetical protein
MGVPPFAAMADEYIRRLIHRHKLSEVELAVRSTQSLLRQPGDHIDELLALTGSAYDSLRSLASAKAQASGPHVLTLSELLDTPKPGQRYAAAPLIPHPGISLIVGASGTFKTWVACTLALALAEGRAFLDHFAVDRPYSILFIEAEMSRDQLSQRFRLLSADSSCDRLRFVIEEAPDFSSPTSSEWLARREEDVIVFDPLVRFFHGDENAAGDVSRFFAETIFPLKRSGRSVVLLHHGRKAVPGRESSDPDAMIRGSTDWQAAVDSVLALQRLDISTALVKHLKARDIREVASFILRLDGDEQRVRLTYQGSGEKTLPGLVPVREALLLALGEEMCSINDLLSALKSRYSESVIRGTLRALEREGLVKRTHLGRRVYLCRNGHHAIQSSLDEREGPHV